MLKPPSQLPRLGDLELEVIEHLWSTENADVLETRAAVGKKRGISPKTVGSALERLHRKGLLGREKVSHAYPRCTSHRSGPQGNRRKWLPQ